MAAVAVSLSSCGQGESSNATAFDGSSNCSAVVEPLALEGALIPRSEQFGGLPPEPLVLTTPADGSLDKSPFRQSLDGLPAAGEFKASASRDVYYLDHLREGMTYVDVLREGGLMLGEHNSGDGMNEVENMKFQFPTEVTDVRVGDYLGVMTQDDGADETDTFPYRVFWTMGKRDYQLAGVRAPEELLSLARELVC